MRKLTYNYNRQLPCIYKLLFYVFFYSRQEFLVLEERQYRIMVFNNT